MPGIRAILIQLLARVKDPMYGFFPVSPASWAFGAGRARRSQGVSSSSEQEGPADLGLALSSDPMVLPWSLTQSSHLALRLASLAWRWAQNPLGKVRLAFPPDTCESLFQREGGWARQL